METKNLKYGLQKMTLLDFPGRVACTVFSSGCNFRCPFCHNAQLVLLPAGHDALDVEDFFTFLGAYSEAEGVLGSATGNMDLWLLSSSGLFPEGRIHGTES